jgi:predicted TIM-barrel fold metal-dependent hydrolase
VAETVGEERLLYASDYSHWDCICPDSVKAIASRGDLSDGVKRKLLGENAARLFKL